MSDLFDRLIQRAHATPPEIRLRPASRFETLGSSASDEQITQEPSGQLSEPARIAAAREHAAPPAPKPVVPFPPHPTDEPTANPTATKHPSSRSSPDSAERALPPVLVSTPAPTPLAQIQPEHVEQIVAPSETAASLVPELIPPHQSDTPPHSAMPELVGNHPRSPRGVLAHGFSLGPATTIPGETRASTRQPLAAPEIESPDPSITITIGRIDIRAVPPPAPVPAPRRTAPAPHLTLEDYLRQRNEGLR